MTTPPEPKFTPPTNDPWKGFRGVMAGTLILEAIVVGLTFPIVARLGDGLTMISGGYLAVVGLALILASGMQGRPQALNTNMVLQLFVIAGGLFHWSIAVIGVVFSFVWIYIWYLRRDVLNKIARGELYGQEPVSKTNPSTAGEVDHTRDHQEDDR